MPDLLEVVPATGPANPLDIGSRRAGIVYPDGSIPVRLSSATSSATTVPGSAPIAFLDASGTTSATVSTSTLALAAGTRTYLEIHNPNTTGLLYVNFGAPATAGSGSFVIAAGGSRSFTTKIPNQAVNVLSPTASLPYTIKYAV